MKLLIRVLLVSLPVAAGCSGPAESPPDRSATDTAAGDTLTARVSAGGSGSGEAGGAGTGRLGEALTRSPGGIVPGQRGGAPTLSYLEARGRTPRVLETREGEATYYADFFHLRRTASGEIFDQRELVAAHRSYPFGTILRVTNLSNDSSVVVRVVDRGPYAPGRDMPAVLDLSRVAAERLDFIREGRTVVRVEVLRWGEE